MTKTLQQEIFDKRYPHTFKLVIQALRHENHSLVVKNKKVIRQQNSKKDNKKLKQFANKLKKVTICPYKHAEIDRAYQTFIHH